MGKPTKQEQEWAADIMGAIWGSIVLLLSLTALSLVLWGLISIWRHIL